MTVEYDRWVQGLFDVMVIMWMCSGSNFTFGLNFSNQFKFFKQVEIFKPVLLSTVWKKAFPFLGCGWKIGAWLLGWFLKRIRAYQKIIFFQFFCISPTTPPSKEGIVANSPLFLSLIITHLSQAPLGQNRNLFILHILNTSTHAHLHQVEAWRTLTKLPIVFLKKRLKSKLKA